MLTFHAMLRATPWARSLSAADLDRIEAETVTRICAAGSLVCRKGEVVESWIGVIDGLVKMTSVSPEGKSMSFVGVGSGGWFGEGSLLKDEPRRYDIVALRTSAIAYMPRATFMWLLDNSMPFKTASC
jgi:CRP-like cAMP-binding protein